MTESHFCAECGGELEGRALVVVAAPGTWTVARPLRWQCKDCGKSSGEVTAVHTPTLRPRAA